MSLGSEARRLLWTSLGLLVFAACPPVNSTPCATDGECRSDQRCRRGACGPLCLDDSECGDRQVCLATGVCGERPECAQDIDCAASFYCSQGRCMCEDDSACPANQVCKAGTCQVRPRCTGDADCLGTGGHCELTQGVCVPACGSPSDCAPTLDPRLAFTLYACVEGSCLRRCTQDLQCGGSGLICRNGLCATADCDDITDCPSGQLCTSAAFGRCEAFTPCTTTSECGRNAECRRYSQPQCPPGFDCNQAVCQELPRCLADGDCVSGVPGTMGAMRTGYCDEGHCQPSPTCQSEAGCSTTQDCIGGVCVPSVCRADGSCSAGSACVDGRCSVIPEPTDVDQLRLTPLSGFLVEGSTMQFHLVAVRLDGTTSPLPTATYEVTDGMGMPSTAATVGGDGKLTAVSAGEVKVRAGVTGSNVRSGQATVRIVPRLMMGRRVIVLDAATGLPLSGVKVRACPAADCSSPNDGVTDVDGVVAFPLLDSSPLTVTAAPTAVRSDGLPTYERASILGTTVIDVALPLRENPVRSAAGFTASVSFLDVSTVGTWWAGFVTASASDVLSLTPQGLLGDNFLTEIPGLNQRFPVPGAVVLYTSPGLGIPQELKSRSLAFAQPGAARFTQAWAGRTNIDAVTSLRSLDLLSYLSAFDYAQERNVRFTSFPYVPDATDVDGDGLCRNTSRCPTGTEDVPDYARFTPLASQPKRSQRLRTEVVVSPLPSPFTTVMAASALFDTTAGMLPTGFASQTASQPGAGGTRAVDPFVVRGGSPYNGLEIAQPGLWVLATDPSGTSQSGRLVRPAVLPTRVSVTPFLPAPALSAYASDTHTLTTGQPAWSSIYGIGGELARASVTGSETRHVIYFAMANNQATVTWPASPSAPGIDPSGEPEARLQLVAVDLRTGVTVDDVFDTAGLNLSAWSDLVDGYSRLDR